MEQRRLGGSEVEVSVVTLGAWAIGGWMWGEQDRQASLDAVATSLELGVTAIDTAPVYGFGASEQLIGEAVKGKRDKVRLLTKYGLRWDSDEGEYHFDSVSTTGEPLKIYKNARAASIMGECEQSLRRLQTDYIDLYQCHWRDNTTPLEETMGAMDKLLKQGKIRAAGVSNFTADEIRRCSELVPIASNQPPYSMLNRDIEADVLPFCRDNNIGIIVYSPLQRGLLSGKFRPGHKFSEGDHRAASGLFSDENIRRVNRFLDQLRPIAEAHNATLAQLVINWTIHRDGVTAALVGARDARQARENAGAAAFTLAPHEQRSIAEMLDELELV